MRQSTALCALALALATGDARGAGGKRPSPPKAECSDPCGGENPPVGPGSLDPFRAPAPKAVELNAAGKAPYRQGKWDEARAQYRAALEADPEFLAPRLNIASSFVRQDRFAEATAEVVALLDKAYVPWAREILEAADLGALKVRPEMKEVNQAMAASAASWTEGLDVSLLFVARQRPPLRVPDGPGVFILNPHQEIWAYTPRTRRYRQLTAEDGHVVAMAQSSDGLHVLYFTAEKLVRGVKPGDVALRGVAVRELSPRTMTLSPRALIEEDVRRLDVYGRMLIGLGEDRQKFFDLAPTGTLSLTDVEGPLGRPLVTLTGHGVTPVGEQRFGGGCLTVARPLYRPGATPTLEIGPPKGKFVPMKAGEGAGLNGLPLP